MINIKEEFLTHEKLARAVNAAGYEALGVWIAIKSHVGSNLTDGYIGEDDLVALKLPKPLSQRKLKSCVKALLECGKKERDGTRGPGLLKMVDGGYEMHDYLDHSNSCEQVELLREKARVKKAKQREQARLELDRVREERRQLERSVPSGVPASVPLGQIEGTELGTSSGTSSGTGEGTGEGTSRVRARDAQTQPNPTQPNDDPDLHESVKDILRPEDLKVDDQTLSGLGINFPGLRKDFARFVWNRWMADPRDPAKRMKRHQWVKYGLRVIEGYWTNTTKRQAVLAALDDPNGGLPPPVDDEARKRREAAAKQAARAALKPQAEAS